MTDELQDLRQRLTRAESVLKSLRDQEVDAIIGKDGVALLRLCDAEKNLRESEQRLRLAQAAGRFGIFEWDLSSQQAVCSVEYFRVMGRSVPPDGKVTLSEWQSWIHPDDRQRVLAVVQTAIDVTGTAADEYRVIDEDGGVRWISYRAQVSRDAQGSLMSMFGAVHEITMHKQAEEERERLIRELEAANRELESYYYTVSHDLRAPVRHLSGFADLLKRKSGDSMDEKGLQYINIIIDAAKNLDSLMEELLKYFRIGRGPLKKRKVDIGALVQSVINIFAEETNGRHIQWQVRPLPEIQGDPALLQIVFINLIGNAVKYTGSRSSAVIEIGTVASDEEYHIYVKDNGVGFDMKCYNKLFGLFQRLHTAKEFEGTGVGLANVQRIIQRHGGRVWAVSKVDEGATFHFALPKG